MELDPIQVSEALSAKKINKFTEGYDLVIKRITNEMGIEKRSNLQKREYRYMERFINGTITHDQFILLIKKFGEKEICRNCFNSCWELFDDYKRGLEAIKKDDEDVAKNGTYRTVSEADGKAMQDPKHGTYIPTHTTHFDKNLGDTAGFVSLGNRGYVANLFKKGYIRKIQSGGAKQLVFQETGEIISDYEAIVVAQALNQERIIIEANMIQNVHGDSKTTKQAISIITNEGKKKNWSYPKTNDYGLEVRKECQKYDNEFGKLLAYAKTGQIKDEKKRQKASRLIFNIIKALNVNVDDCVATVTKMNTKKRL